MRQPTRTLSVALLLTGALLAPTAPDRGTESSGNTDGLLTWDLGAIEAGQTAREVVLFAFDRSYEKLTARLDGVRGRLRELPSPPDRGDASGRVWIANEATDFALDAPGSFFWEGDRQSLTCEHGGQLSRFGYYVHYDGTRAGTSINSAGEVENLRVIEPVAAAGSREALGTLETVDGTLRIRVRAIIGEGAEAAVEFLLTNVSEAPASNVRLSAYANIESAHTHEGDYCTLDQRTGGVLTVDPSTGWCVVMAGLTPPASGHVGAWASQGELEAGAGVAWGEWQAFAGLSEERLRHITATVAIPHPIADYFDVREPETRTLTEAEADELLVRDWLFQADEQPTYWRTRQEIRWARQLADRLARDHDGLDLSAELRELKRLEERYAAGTQGPTRRGAPLPDGMLACWTFDGSGERAIDDVSGHGRAGAVVGVVDRVPGVLGEALALGGGSFVDVGSELATVARGNYTLTAWMRTTSGEADILGNGVGEGCLLFMAYKGVLRGHQWTSASGNVIDGKTAVNDGRWHHVAQVVDDARISLYVDGALDSSQEFVGEKTAAESPILLGARSTSHLGSAFTGSLDDVCVFDRPLTAAEISGMFDDGKNRADNADPEAVDAYLAVRRVKRRIMFKNPLIDFDSLLFIDQPYPRGSEWPHEARHRDGMMAVPGGRLLVLEGLHPGGKIRKLAPGDTPASFWRPDLSFDGKRVLFCMKPKSEKSFHLYEINVDGSGLSQLTNSPYDDLDPIYLPDGHLMFSTTRCNTYIRCMPYTYAYVLARCDADGSNIYLVSRGNEPDWLPTLLDDGRVAYTRWEYTDKALWRIQSLWATNPDGTNTVTFWGNQSVWPDMLIEPRPIPGSSRVMFTGAAHHDWFAGSIGIIDRNRGLNFPDGLTKITADVPWPECGAPPLDPIEADDYHRSGAFTAFKTPYPLSEADFLVSARAGDVPSNGDGKFKLYLMDVHGNRELVYEGEHNIWHAMPVKPRRRPTPKPDQVAWPGTGEDHQPPKPGVFFSTNVYQGVPDLPRGKVKYLRVIQMDSRTYSTWTRDQMPHQHQGPTVSILQSDGVKRILGTVPVREDGSVKFEVPPGKALHFQLLDQQYRALQTMRSFTGVMPGERRGCVGCHEMHSVSPVNERGAALEAPAAKLTPPPWGAETTLGYERLIQPILERHCGKCHTGDGAGREKFDVTLRPGQGVFKEPYVTIVGGSVYHGEKRLEPVPSLAACPPVESWPRAGVPQSVRTFRPMQYLSYASKLVNHHAASGEHHDVRMEGRDLRTLIAWVDAVCPYRGDAEIRAIPDPNFPGIERLPIRPRTATAPRIDRFNIPQDEIANRPAQLGD